MNREKKQLAVVGVLVVLILGVGAFQFMQGGETPPPADAKKTETKATDKTDEKTPLKNVGLPNLPAKDPFTPASFIGEEAPANQPTTPEPKQPVQSTHGAPKLGFDTKETLPHQDWKPGGKVSDPPVEPAAPPKPIFGYSLVGIVEGNHPTAVFEDGKGNQQLVEVGQGIGPSATVTQITRGKVRVKFNAETLTFNVGGNPNAK